MALVKNISTGPRGAYLKGVLAMAEVGQTIEADDFAPEWFENVGSDGDDDGDGDGHGEGLAAHTVAELKAIAEADGIDLGEATKKADIIAAIEAAHAAG